MFVLFRLINYLLNIARPYLGELVGVYSDWTPLRDRSALYVEPADPDDFPELDEPALARYTETLVKLGFVHALDYSIETDVPMGGRRDCMQGDRLP